MSETTTPTYAHYVPLGTDVETGAYRPVADVVGDVEQSPGGNSILRVGPLTPGNGWQQKAYVVLSPAERERLIADLIAHRDFAPVSGENTDDGDERDYLDVADDAEWDDAKILDVALDFIGSQFLDPELVAYAKNRAAGSEG